MSTEHINIGSTGRVSMQSSVKQHFSTQHFRAAVFFVEETQAIETTISTPDETQRSRHRAYVTAAILSAVAFLETSINELYLLAIDRNSIKLPTFDKRLFDLFSQFWEVVEKYPILHKYQIALLLAGEEQFGRGGTSYQQAENLVKLRDCLVHYKPEWDDEAGQHQKLKDRLQARFPLNPYASGNTLWFPHKCLGAGCAHWSVETARSFSDEFCRRLGIPRVKT